jgi:hypothetical protein
LPTHYFPVQATRSIHRLPTLPQLTFSGCHSVEPMRTILLAPAAVAKAAALAVSAPEQRWMLAQPREVRRSYVEEVVDRPNDPKAQERWMLRQPDAVRLSYIRDVLDA